MLRVETETGWWLVTHPDHAALAAQFAHHWGDDLFAPPSPRANVLRAIHAHDDGWAARDAHPSITRAGKPSAFSEELVGKYSAFEEIDLSEYLAVRERALDSMEQECAYAALLICMHTQNLLSERADRSTIAATQLPLLDTFLDRQQHRQQALRDRLLASSLFKEPEVTDSAIEDNFHLLQAMDNLSLLSCVSYTRPGTLLHPLRTHNGTTRTVQVLPAAERNFRLDPYPFDRPLLKFDLPARHVEGKLFQDAEELQQKFQLAPIQPLTITISR